MNNSRVIKLKIVFYSILTTVAFSMDCAIVEDDVIKTMVRAGDMLYGNAINMLF